MGEAERGAWNASWMRFGMSVWPCAAGRSSGMLARLTGPLANASTSATAAAAAAAAALSCPASSHLAAKAGKPLGAAAQDGGGHSHSLHVGHCRAGTKQHGVSINSSIRDVLQMRRSRQVGMHRQVAPAKLAVANHPAKTAPPVFQPACPACLPASHAQHIPLTSGGAAVEAHVGGEGWLQARLALLALQALNQRRLLACGAGKGKGIQQP